MQQIQSTDFSSESDMIKPVFVYSKPTVFHITEFLYQDQNLYLFDKDAKTNSLQKIDRLSRLKSLIGADKIIDIDYKIKYVHQGKFASVDFLNAHIFGDRFKAADIVITTYRDFYLHQADICFNKAEALAVGTFNTNLTSQGAAYKSARASLLYQRYEVLLKKAQEYPKKPEEYKLMQKSFYESLGFINFD